MPPQDDSMTEATRTRTSLANPMLDTSQKSPTPKPAEATESPMTEGELVETEEAMGKEEAPEQGQNIGLGTRWGSFRTNMQARMKNRMTKNKDITKKDQTAKDIEVPHLSPEEMQAMRASKVSFTVVKETVDDRWGFAVNRSESDPTRIQIQAKPGGGLLDSAPFQVGDTLLSVNNQKCTDVEETTRMLVDYESCVPITLICEVPGGNYSLVEAVVRKPASDTEVELGIGFCNKDLGNQNLLLINNLSSTGLFAHSTLSQGDLLLAINGTQCHNAPTGKADELIAESMETVSIVAMRPNAEPPIQGTRMQRWMRQAKRAGVALGGGTMVGVGLIFIPTLPPPFGEVLIAGGVAVLGTEFEAPKRAMKKCRDSLENAVGREAELIDDKPQSVVDANQVDSSNEVEAQNGVAGNEARASDAMEKLDEDTANLDANGKP